MQRRQAIISALHRLMETKGYAETTLTDLAAETGLSVSHILYYFKNKQAVLEELCKQSIARGLSEITGYRNDPPEERIHVLVDYSFGLRDKPRNELRMTFEVLALSLHMPAIRKLLSEYNRELKNYLIDLFEKVPRRPGVSAEDAAEAGMAVWLGLLNNVQFDATVDTGRARRLLRRALLYVAGLEAEFSTHNPLRLGTRG
jgi:AcrR family transcriptional regulator